MPPANIGIIGHPLGHTLSPVFQNVALRHHGIDAEFTAWPVAPDDLAAKVESFRAPDFIASCVTLPHKQAVIPMIDELADTAKAVGAVNWIINDGGKLVGHNTDAPGFYRALTELGGFTVAGRNAVVLGAGGAARAIVYALVNAGIGQLTIANRTLERAQALATEFSASTDAEISSVEMTTFALSRLAPSIDLWVNTTSVGMAGGPAPNQSPIDANLLRAGQTGYDAVYAPPETPFLRDIKAAGGTALGGLTMLVLQGAVGFELATGKPAPVADMFAAVDEAIGK